MSISTLPVQDTRHKQDDGEDTPRLHAYPSGSRVALCGRLRAQGDTANADRFCKTCEQLASSVLHRG